MHFHVAFKVCLSRKTLSTISPIFSPIFQENCVFSYLKHRCSHTGKFHTECFSVLYAFSCDCCIGLHHFLSHHITYTERVCHCVSCTVAVPISPGWEIFLSTTTGLPYSPHYLNTQHVETSDLYRSAFLIQKNTRKWLQWLKMTPPWQ